MTNLVATGPTPVSAFQEEIIRNSGGGVDFAISSELSCHYDPASAVLWAVSTPRGIPCFSLDLLRDMERGSHIVEGYFAGKEASRPLRYIVIRSGVPGAFNVGGDLAYFLRLIEAQDRARLTEYSRAAINVAYRNYIGHGIRGVTTVALLEGDALGGGFESALSCDIVIAEEHVKAGLPEVLFNMFPGSGGLSFLARRVNPRVSDEIARTGRLYPAQELFEMGVIDEVVSTGGAQEAMLRLIRQRERQYEAHAAMNVVSRLLRPISLSELNDVARLWVDTALRLDERGKQWMRRLRQQQAANFGALTLVQTPARVAVASP